MSTRCIILTAYLFVLGFFSAFGGTVIKGHIQGLDGKVYGNQDFTVQVVDDFITFKKRTLVRGTSGKHGEFEVEFELARTSFLFVNFQKVQRTFYAQPTKFYYLDIKVPMEGLSNKQKEFSKNIAGATIINSDKKGLNYLIDTLDYACTSFLQNNIRERKDRGRVSLFIESLRVEFEKIKSPFFQDYLRYKEAELMQFIYKNRREAFAERYFNKEMGIAQHIQKMHVFSSFFKGNLRYHILIDDKSPFHDSFNEGDLRACLRLISPYQDVSRELRELLLLKGIYEVHSQEYYELNKEVDLLDKLIGNSPYATHRLIALHIKQKITHLKANYLAPILNIKSPKGVFNALSNGSKYTYLSFFNSWDESFQEEMALMETMTDKYGDDLEIVCIAVDQDTIQFDVLKKEYGKKIRFVHYNFQSEVLLDFRIQEFRLDRYDIKAATKHYLVDPDGYLVFSPAKAPTKGFYKDFQRIIAQ